MVVSWLIVTVYSAKITTFSLNKAIVERKKAKNRV